MANIHLSLPNTILVRIAKIAEEEFQGNMTRYATHAILLDLLRREILTKEEYKIVLDK